MGVRDMAGRALDGDVVHYGPDPDWLLSCFGIEEQLQQHVMLPHTVPRTCEGVALLDPLLALDHCYPVSRDVDVRGAFVCA
jgi:hypothetical protein